MACLYDYLNRQRSLFIKPAYIAEILTVRQCIVLREHTVRHLETTCIGQAVFNLECIQVAFFLDYTELFPPAPS